MYVLVNSLMYVFMTPGGAFAPAIGESLVRTTSAGWRGVFYVLIAINAAALLCFTLFYWAPTFREKHGSQMGLRSSVRLFRNPPVRVRPDTLSHGPLLGWLSILMAVLICGRHHCCRRVIVYCIHSLGVVWSNPAAARSDAYVAKCAMDGGGHHLGAWFKPLLWPCRRLAINGVSYLCLLKFCP